MHQQHTCRWITQQRYAIAIQPFTRTTTMQFEQKEFLFLFKQTRISFAYIIYRNAKNMRAHERNEHSLLSIGYSHQWYRSNIKTNSWESSSHFFHSSRVCFPVTWNTNDNTRYNKMKNIAGEWCVFFSTAWFFVVLLLFISKHSRLVDVFAYLLFYKYWFGFFVFC